MLEMDLTPKWSLEVWKLPNFPTGATSNKITGQDLGEIWQATAVPQQITRIECRKKASEIIARSKN